MAAKLKAADFEGELDDDKRSKLIRSIMAHTHRDYRSKKGDETHPSVLWNQGGQGTCLILLMTASNEDLFDIAKESRVFA